MNIAIIGAGSYKWGPLNIRDIILTQCLSQSKITLYDIDAEALELVFQYSKMIETQAPYGIKIFKTSHLEHALDGKDIIILSISVGGLNAMEQDLQLAEKYGYFYPVGDTVGIPGFSRGLRHTKTIIKLGHLMEKYCPQAYLINTTNPIYIIT
ncbi:hypothetical protein GF406_23265 [candidate division KSB1 bacterium]|nr:hypothetical protein [candidate division KSB1 bacterium]